MGSQMIGYGNYSYTLANGKDSVWFIAGIACQKNYVSVYIAAADKDGYLAENNKHRLGKVSVGKSCIRIKKLEDVDLAVLAELVQKAVALANS